MLDDKEYGEEKEETRTRGAGGDVYQAKACPKTVKKSKKGHFVRKTTIKKWFNSFMEISKNKRRKEKVQFLYGKKECCSSRSTGSTLIRMPQTILLKVNKVTSQNEEHIRKRKVRGCRMSILGKGVSIQTKTPIFPHKIVVQFQNGINSKNRAQGVGSIPEWNSGGHQFTVHPLQGQEESEWCLGVVKWFKVTWLFMLQ